MAKETFHSVDTQIWRAIWRWCVRRHPQKDCGR
ncbi:group II intron maturase-specific domain-containing protein [Escherichia coli]